MTTTLNANERLERPTRDSLPDQVVVPDSPLPEARFVLDHSVHYFLPPHAYVCTHKDGTDCIGQVLRVAHKTTGDYWQNYFLGVCQNSQHRSEMIRHVTERSGRSITPTVQGLHLHTERFPAIDPDTTPEAITPEPEPITVELPGHSDLQRRLLAYTIGNDGTVSSRHAAFQYLAERDAFFPGRSESLIIEAMEELVEENPMGACPEGLARFREAFDLNPTRRYRCSLFQGYTKEGPPIASFTYLAPNGDDEPLEEHDVDLGEFDTAVREAIAGVIENLPSEYEVAINATADLFWTIEEED